LKLEIKVNKESLHIQNSVARAQYEVEKARKHREETAVVGGLLGILAPIFPPLAIPALISVGMAHDYNLDVQDGSLREKTAQSDQVYLPFFRKACFRLPTQFPG
jgi:hypothetical protein